MATTTLAALALPASAVITAPILARALGPEGRGEAAALLTPIALATLAFTFGLPEAVTYFVASRRASPQSTARLALGLGALAGVIAAGALILVQPLLLGKYPQTHALFRVLAATLPFNLAFMMLRYVAQGHNRFDLVRRERWASVLGRLALIVGLAIAGSLTVKAAVWSTHGTALAALLLLVPILYVRTGRDAPPIKARPLLRFGATTWIGTLSGLLILRLDQALLPPLASLRQLGYYAVAVALAEIPLTALYSVRDVSFTASAGRSDPAFVARVTRVVMLLAVPLAVVGIALAPVIVPLVFGHDFSPATHMSQVLFIALVPSAVATVLSAALFGAERPGAVSFAQIVALVVTVAGLFALVPPLGAIGAAWTTLAAYLVNAALIVVAVRRLTGLTLRDCFLPTIADAKDLLALVRRA